MGQSAESVTYDLFWRYPGSCVSSTKSSIAVVNTFLQKINQNLSTKLSGSHTKDKRKRPLEKITSQSQQNKRFKSFGKDVHKAVDELIIKHKLINVSGESIIHLQQIGFNYKKN
ncbi:hypothetical protein GLOIN_2v1761838 [Rhizophagus irregularis DAOM 181602=DAOM 197198]|uniref:Uncharacterized protein n=1 Tax=Rhizophagus irregularis (strain DAOM 181602 / DAOM 197198 / MUCL 43194) TaxID=747089 RepID=A0A2P4QZ45_RHIID|nr:hypothetical protein GLOIN_2v1761838 [Rhizophagus irregularis DAOM 181602=DAOM 197198]POG82917.1 hypothetical protein GLOIN_2v1761838 [Rhizophagus irregularis DAOM 181602=DAOM 197198]GBC45685.2 hypothetical protein GLOIN_2v1761838 [Rhizophagus irregularis DAOM 181602=DAOM 197198]|eukprot:XP_025189783.1 hypothetical protein GLOIN_2v1761838 [Rhizophagus irregularis DAOM 181602=DAOM 197198]